uniref:Uncharacterized protein n=1 Tax=Pararge aegeria TaxID=116150 RepID=S4PC98_9NEOP
MIEKTINYFVVMLRLLIIGLFSLAYRYCRVLYKFTMPGYALLILIGVTDRHLYSKIETNFRYNVAFNSGNWLV